MADIINSSDYQGLTLQEDFKKNVAYINEKFKKKLISPLTITLGDEFQGIAKSLKISTEIIITLEELLMKENANFSLRYIINFGKIDTPINSEIAYGMLGDGLSHARKMLENLKKKEQRFEIAAEKEDKSKALNDAFEILQNLQNRWTSEADKKLVSQFIQYQDYKIIATKTGITRSQIWKKEKSLNISSYFAIKNLISYLSK
ncbi:SatD family protein [Lacihabitans sp. LS3-19]|uniref:SatD family protein n=1 Tax=Lacihabitans sp. LS3-19 TaxID=2487335 RepID=UPI0020CEECDF|nr:SatD family protein [Lacihabitans sp. LS3-19]